MLICNNHMRNRNLANFNMITEALQPGRIVVWTLHTSGLNNFDFRLSNRPA